ncbi:MAG TPA: hypothetical protein VEU28_05285 [Actinomycetota bacterium]|nr:hypothetical protein [Actinomycetota bacterium]
MGAARTTSKPIGTAAGIALAGAVAVSALATFGGEQQDDQTSTYWMVALFLAGITALVFGLVVRPAMREAGSNRAALSGLITSIAGILTIVAYWSGLPVILGTAGALMGMYGKERAEQGAGRRGMALTATVLGILAAAAAAAIVVMDIAAN